MSTPPIPKRGDVWLVDFDPSVGAEMRKTRPAIILSLDGLGKLPLRIVVPLTDWRPAFTGLSWFVSIPASPANGLVKDSGADAFQVKSISQRRFIYRLSAVTAKQLEEIASAVANCVGAP